MELEQKILGQRNYHKPALLAYGCKRIKGGYLYTKPFADDNFYARIEVNDNGKVEAHCIDCETQEIYTPIYINDRGGIFVNRIKNEYIGVLQAFAEACGERLPFLKAQSNRIAAYIFERYGERPDFPFKNDDVDGVFRYPTNRKWYAIIMRVCRGKVDKTESDEMIEVMNIKATHEDHEALLKKPGYYPAYHMGKSSWVSVILDESVADRDILVYLEKSRSSVLAKKQRLNK